MSEHKNMEISTINTITGAVFGLMALAFIVGVINYDKGLPLFVAYWSSPLVLYIFLRKKSKEIHLDKEGNKIVRSAVFFFVSAVFIFLAFTRLGSDTRTVCDQVAGYGNNAECVGDYITVGGTDWTGALFSAGIGYFFYIRGRLEING